MSGTISTYDFSVHFVIFLLIFFSVYKARLVVKSTLLHQLVSFVRRLCYYITYYFNSLNKAFVKPDWFLEVYMPAFPWELNEAPVSVGDRQRQSWHVELKMPISAENSKEVQSSNPFNSGNINLRSHSPPFHICFYLGSECKKEKIIASGSAPSGIKPG